MMKQVWAPLLLLTYYLLGSGGKNSRILAKMAPQLLQPKHKEEHGNRSKSKPKEGWEER